ncbi:MAG: hypothetical protein QF707_03840 [Candidatus Poseidoniaceae archaeon]|nr:hypothetical protein [Candidatus Poseidoniaceae archaeon]MDP7203810.1 hypothetical protein [Candidatus Poseidoniaceae archaeon]
MSEHSEEVLRTAAIMAVLSLIQESSQSESIGRRSGTAWAQDHRRLNSGQSSLLWRRSSRSPWR